MPDSRAKQSAGNLPDATAFMVNNPSGDKLLLPLAITLSDDGRLFPVPSCSAGGQTASPEVRGPLQKGLLDAA